MRLFGMTVRTTPSTFKVIISSWRLVISLSSWFASISILSWRFPFSSFVGVELAHYHTQIFQTPQDRHTIRFRIAMYRFRSWERLVLHAHGVFAAVLWPWWLANHREEERGRADQLEMRRFLRRNAFTGSRDGDKATLRVMRSWRGCTRPVGGNRGWNSQAVGRGPQDSAAGSGQGVRRRQDTRASSTRAQSARKGL